MDFQYVTNEKGKRVSVIAPIKEWEKRDSAFKELAKATKGKIKKKKSVDAASKTKKKILDGITRGVEEVNLIRAGKLKGKALKDVLNEL